MHHACMHDTSESKQGKQLSITLASKDIKYNIILCINKCEIASKVDKIL